MLYRRIAAYLLAWTTSAHALAIGTPPRARQVIMMAEDDPTGSPLIKAINALQEAIQQSPAAQFKKGLAKLQAGDYDEASVKAQLSGYIAEPAVMFSFTT